MKRAFSLIVLFFTMMSSVNAQQLPDFNEFNLTSTNTLDGIKCEHYAEGFRKYICDNGDFMWFEELYDIPYEMSRSSIPDSHIVGEFLFTTNEGIRIVREKQKYSNGEEYYVLGFVFPNYSFIILTDYISKDIKFGSGYTKWFNAFRNKTSKGLHWYGSNSLYYLSPDKDPLECVEFKHLSLFKKGNRLYGVKKDGSLMAMAQELNEEYYFASQHDSIVCATTLSDGVKLDYANGDNVLLWPNGDGIINANIHRNDNLITIKQINDNIVATIKYKNGDVFVGQSRAFAVYNELPNYDETIYDIPFNNSEHARMLGFTDIIPWEGLMNKVDGSSYKIEKGLTPDVIEAQKQAEKAKEIAQYNELCNQFGKQYVDSALKGEVIVGMPESLLKAAFQTSLYEEGNGYKIYRITGFGWVGNTFTDNALKYSVWVVNGKVSSIKYWR